MNPKATLPLEIRQAVSRLVSAVRADVNEPVGWNGVTNARKALYSVIEKHLPVPPLTEDTIKEALHAGKIVVLEQPWLRVDFREDGRLGVANTRSDIWLEWDATKASQCKVLTRAEFVEAERGDWK